MFKKTETPARKFHAGQPNHVILDPGSDIMLPALDSQKVRLQELNEQRKPLAARFQSTPEDTHLAVELRLIDDEIAECNRQIQGHRRKQK